MTVATRTAAAAAARADRITSCGAGSLVWILTSGSRAARVMMRATAAMVVMMMVVPVVTATVRPPVPGVAGDTVQSGRRRGHQRYSGRIGLTTRTGRRRSRYR